MLQFPHREIIKLIVAYTLVGALVFTVAITCLSLIGLIEFADKKQQSKLFYALIIELVVLSVGFFGNYLSFDSRKAEEKVATYIDDSVDKKVLEKLSAQRFYAEKFSWQNFHDFFLKVKDRFQLKDSYINAYKAAAINQLMWRNEFKIIYDEYTYHYIVDILEFDESGAYHDEVVGYKDSNSVLEFFKDEGIPVSRSILNEIYNSLNMFSYYQNSSLIPDYVIRIYGNEKMGIRFQKVSEK